MAASLPASSAPPPSVRGMGRNWLVYGVSSVASRLVGFLLLPVYTRILSPEDYGVRAMVALSVDLVALLFSFGIGTAMTRYYAGEGDRRHPEAISTGLLVKAGTFGIGVMLGLACSAWLTHLILGDPVYAPYLRLGLVSLFFISFVDSGMTYLRARQRAGTVAILSLASLLAAV